LQLGEMVDHEGHDLVCLTLVDAGDARLLACCALPERMPGRALTSQVPSLAASLQRLGKPRVGGQRRLGQRAIGSDAFGRRQDRRRLRPVILAQPGPVEYGFGDRFAAQTAGITFTLTLGSGTRLGGCNGGEASEARGAWLGGLWPLLPGAVVWLPRVFDCRVDDCESDRYEQPQGDHYEGQFEGQNGASEG